LEVLPAARVTAAREIVTTTLCKNQACILYFYDTTKNHRRNWCSMGICGNA
jgi:predicted RNA-binding Zn ribbon-like protein